MKAKSKYFTVEEYMVLQPANIKAVLEQLRQVMKKAAPKAEEVISYKMPALKYHGMVVWYIARKGNCGVYIRPRVLDRFKEELEPYRRTKSTIYFPYDEPLPKKPITAIVKCAVEMNLNDTEVKEIVAKSKKKK